MSCNNVDRTEPKTFEEREMELKDYSEEERNKILWATIINDMNKEQVHTYRLILCQFIVMIVTMAFPILSIAQTDTLTVKINKPRYYKGLSLTLLHKTAYHPMVGTSVFLKAEYKNRKDIIAIGTANCEPDLNSYYLWQGFIFKIPYPTEKSNTDHLTLLISREKTKKVEKIFSQENLQLAYQKLKQEMNIAENQPGNSSGIQIRSESISLNLEYQHGKVHHRYDWQEFISEQIQVSGQMLKQGHYDYGFNFRLLKSDNGEIVIYSGPIDKNEEGVSSSLKFLIDQK